MKTFVQTRWAETRERIQFVIALSLAHALFSDVTVRKRHGFPFFLRKTAHHWHTEDGNSADFSTYPGVNLKQCMFPLRWVTPSASVDAEISCTKRKPFASRAFQVRPFSVLASSRTHTHLSKLPVPFSSYLRNISSLVAFSAKFLPDVRQIQSTNQDERATTTTTRWCGDCQQNGAAIAQSCKKRTMDEAEQRQRPDPAPLYLSCSPPHAVRPAGNNINRRNIGLA